MKLKWMLQEEAEAGTTAGGTSSTPATETPAATTPSAEKTGASALPEAGTPASDLPTHQDESSVVVPAEEEASSVDWNDLMGTDDEDEAAASPAATEAATSSSPVTPAASPTTPAPAALQPSTPATVTPPAAEQTPAVVTPAAPQKTEAELQAEAAASYDRYEKELTAHYKIPDDLAAKLETEPEVVLPVLASRMHIAIVSEVMARVQRTLPQAMAEHKTLETREQAAREAFFTKWPGLKGKDEYIFKAGGMFRGMNPQATHEQAVNGVGRLVYAALGLPVPGDPAPQQQPLAGGTQPAAGAPGAPQASPFKPAGPGAAGGTPPGNETNPFAKMAEDFLHEDLNG